MISRTPALVCIILGGLAACTDRGRGASDASVCAPFNGAVASTGAPGGEASVLDDCLHRTAYRLARAPDSAEIVGQATVAACGEALSRWNTAAVSQPGGAGASDAAVDLITGQSASQIAQRYQYAQGRALYYVVQGRAGRCEVPAATAGAAVR